MNTEALLPLSLFILRRRFWQPAAWTRPRGCGSCRPTTRQRLVWRLCRGTVTLFTLLRFIPLRMFLQLAVKTTQQSCGGCRPTTRQRLVWPLWRGTVPVFTLLRFIPLRMFLQPAATTIPRSCGDNFDLSLFFFSISFFLFYYECQFRNWCVAFHFLKMNDNGHHLPRASNYQ